jgi:hypothetical protein
MTDEPFEYSYSWDTGVPEGDITHMEHRGKFWFDERWEGDVKTERFKLNGNWVTVEYTADNENFVDLTDYRPLARFLRWVLRR